MSGPRTPIEEGLAEIWGEVLRIEQVGVHTDFFELGGHSLLATQVISRIRSTFAGGVAPAGALRGSHDRRTGRAHRGGERLETEAAAPPWFVSLARVRLPLSFAQQRLWFIDQLEPESSVYNIPMALRLRGALDVAALQQSLQEIVRRHEALRTTFALHDGRARPGDPGGARRGAAGRGLEVCGG